MAENRSPSLNESGASPQSPYISAPAEPYRRNTYLNESLPIETMSTPKNPKEPCPCGSGLPYFKCHGKPKAGETADLKRPTPPAEAKAAKPLPRP